jgi:hypothetical protein
MMPCSLHVIFLWFVDLLSVAEGEACLSPGIKILGCNDAILLQA